MLLQIPPPHQSTPRLTDFSPLAQFSTVCGSSFLLIHPSMIRNRPRSAAGAEYMVNTFSQMSSMSSLWCLITSLRGESVSFDLIVKLALLLAHLHFSDLIGLRRQVFDHILFLYLERPRRHKVHQFIGVGVVDKVGWNPPMMQYRPLNKNRRPR